MLGRHLPDQAADQACFLAAFEFLDRVLDVVKRNHWNADEAPWRDFAVVDQPVIGDLKAGLLNVGVFQRKQPETKRRIEDLRGNAIDFHFAEARFRIPAAGLFTGRISRREFGIFFQQFWCQILFKKVHRFHDMGVRRNDFFTGENLLSLSDGHGSTHSIPPLISLIFSCLYVIQTDLSSWNHGMWTGSGVRWVLRYVR